MKKVLLMALALSSLVVFSGLGVAHQRDKEKKPRVEARTEATEIHWRPTSRTQTYEQFLRSLRRKGLTARVRFVDSPGGGPQGVIVIYGSGGGCRLCIGSASACGSLCGAF